MRWSLARTCVAATALLGAVATMVSVGVAQQAPAAPAVAAAPLERLVAATNIPFEQFTLSNGLRVIVHTDRKAPIVAVSVWYGVGSADEPKGKTGFAHLFEHLMFNGSGNYDGEFFVPLEEIGATDYNGTTWLDRTNYFQNVPTPALDLALFLEADRMGNLLPAVTEAKLDNQRGVVQNEKRQGDNEPFGLVDYAIQGSLYPEGHPYHHDTIGSMADLDAATMADVRAWFGQHYGPNNAVVVLAGDIDLATAKTKMQRYFGAIPRGPASVEPNAGVPDRTAVTRTTMSDRVANPRLYFSWATPSQLRQESISLDIATSILAGGQSSRLHNILVRDEQLAIAVSGFQLPFQLSSQVRIAVDIKPGVDPAKVEARVEQALADFLANGPTEAEVRRVATRDVAGVVRGLEQVGGFGGKAVALAEGALYANDPAFYRRQLGWMAAATPASVQQAAKAWLADGSHRVLVTPGERGAQELALAGEAAARPAAAAETAPEHSPDRSKLPRVTAETQLSFPAVERATLSNGAEIVFARRTGVPIVSISARFDAGIAADDPNKLGLHAMMIEMQREGTATRNGRQIVEAYELLGAAAGYGGSQDVTSYSVVAMKPNLAVTLSVFSDVIRNPAFPAAELQRVRTIQLGRIAQEENNPNGIGARALTPMVFGPGHPYAKPSTLGTTAGVTSVTREDLVRFHDTWIRPDNMRLFVVGDTTLAEIKAQLEQAFGGWRPNATVARGAKTFPAVAPQGVGRILLIDRPKSPQSVIFAAMPVGLNGGDDPIALRISNEVLGGTFTSRLNTNLRETKGWSYGVRSSISASRNDLTFTIVAPVQSDRTADSIRALQEDVTSYLGGRPIDATEFSRAINSNARELPGAMETAGAVRSVLETNSLLGRPDSYIAELPARYRAMRSEDTIAAIRRSVDPAKLTWVVVGDAATVEPQLKTLGIPIDRR